MLFRQVDGTVSMALAMSVFRGAVLKPTAKAAKEQAATRRMRVTKASPAPLSLQQCSRVRLMELIQRDETTWTATALGRCHLCDPVDTILCELTPLKVHVETMSMSIRFSKEVSVFFREWKKQEQKPTG